jgi:outer membrane murein-binding lipoprotein Lpp
MNSDRGGQLDQLMSSGVRTLAVAVATLHSSVDETSPVHEF